jgi:hypothetical protein
LAAPAEMRTTRARAPEFTSGVGDNSLWRRRAFGFWLVPNQIEATNLQQWGYANSTTHSDTRRDFPVLRE